jgi:ArsR family metal-binding transcriptional regulator
MEIYKLLPQTNCKVCGQPSCFAFASQVTVGAAGVDGCTPLLSEMRYIQQRQALLEMLAEAASKHTKKKPGSPHQGAGFLKSRPAL